MTDQELVEAVAWEAAKLAPTLDELIEIHLESQTRHTEEVLKSFLWENKVGILRTLEAIPLIRKAALEEKGYYPAKVVSGQDMAHAIRAAVLEEAAKIAKSMRYEGYCDDDYAMGYEAAASQLADKLLALLPAPQKQEGE